MSPFVSQPIWHPVSVVFLDDNEDFLRALQGVFRERALNHFFSKPQAALDFTLSRHRRAPRLRMAGTNLSEIERAGNALGTDALIDETRFEAIAAVVVDYDMPDIDGIRFLGSIGEVECTKILLTGAAGYREAVEAFNAGLIDVYLRKTEADLPRKLADALMVAKKKHCASRGYIGMHDIGTAYSNPSVVRLIEELAARENVVEYYWRPEQNAVLMFDGASQASVFIAWDAEEWAFQIDAVADAGGPRWLRQGLLAREILPLFWPHQAYRPDLTAIPTAQPLPVPGCEDTFYCLARLDIPGIDAGLTTFAKWRRAKLDSANGRQHAAR